MLTEPRTSADIDRAVADDTRCPICAATETRPLIRQPSGPHLRLQRVFNIQQCRECRAAWVLDPPSAEDLAGVYDDHFFETSQQSAPVDERGAFTPAAERAPIVVNARRRVAELCAACGGGTLLDIGCGKGIFLKLASQHFDVIGVDVSPAACRFARDVLRLDVRCGDFLTLDLPPAAFDVITLWDVLASLPDPRAAVARIAALLKPGGWLVMTLPDIDTPAFKLARGRWPLLIPPINLVYFSRPAAARLLRDHGLSLVRYTHAGKLLSTNFVLRKLGRIFRIQALDRESVGIPGLRNVYLNLGDIALVWARREGAA
ncbi:MAG: class I SAM-dependent methyltransferase [Phycisphaerae bacterium]|jgi:SAM-dependent methyltransferase